MTVILKENCSHTPQADQRQVKHSRQSRSNKTSLHHQLSLPGNGTLLVIFFFFFFLIGMTDYSVHQCACFSSYYRTE